MTDDAWLKVSEAIVRGYRQLPYIKENPQWGIVELLDEFQSGCRMDCRLAKTVGYAQGLRLNLAY